MFRKAAAAVGIFVLLFSGAFVLQGRNIQDNNTVENVETDSDIMNVRNTTLVGEPLLKPFVEFLPREYVRIE